MQPQLRCICTRMLVPATHFIGFLLFLNIGNAAFCPETWIDGSVVGLGCLLFDSSLDLTWEEANNFCQFTNNATLLEILTEEQLVFTQLELTLLAKEEAELQNVPDLMDISV